jgi:hypothetical protein
MLRPRLMSSSALRHEKTLEWLHEQSSYGDGCQTWFALARPSKASLQIRKYLDKYLALAGLTNDECGALSVFVPPMPGIHDDMRDWSFFIILEHNAIVNPSVTSLIENLVRGEEPKGAGAIDPKKDVMPSKDSGVEQIEAFR